MLHKANTLRLRKSRRWRDMSIEDRVRELNGGTYTKKRADYNNKCNSKKNRFHIDRGVK